MAYGFGIRIRIRRVRDGWIAYDSGTAVSNASEMILDLDGSPGTEGYVVEGQYVDNGAPGAQGPASIPKAMRQTLVALALRK